MTVCSVLSLPQGCPDGWRSCRPSLGHGDAASVMVALGLVALADILRRRGSASRQAYEALIGATAEIRAALRHLLDPSQPKSLQLAAGVHDAVDNALLLSREALLEPRCFGAPWTGDLFASCCASIHLIRCELSISEMSTTDTERAGCPKTQALSTLLRMPAFRRIPKAVFDQLDVLVDSLVVFSRQAPDTGDRQPEPEMLANFDEEIQRQVCRFLEEVNRLGAFKGNLSATSMAQDPAAQLSVVLCSIMTIVTEISKWQIAMKKAKFATAQSQAPVFACYKRKADWSPKPVST